LRSTWEAEADAQGLEQAHHDLDVIRGLIVEPFVPVGELIRGDDLDHARGIG
jgi:hypothetical protein